jgi:hypothetical protein
MKLSKVPKSRCKINSPWTNKGSIWNLDAYDVFEYEDYPEMFEQVYAFEDGTEVFLNDTVFRIKTVGYSKTIASVKLQLCHISGEVEVFPTRESAQEALTLENEAQSERLNTDNRKNIMENISILSNVVDFDTLSIATIKSKLVQINRLSSYETIV